MDCLRYLDKNLYISGGEDTTLRLSAVDPETESFLPVAIIRSHISSIRAISFVQIRDFFLVVSAGGRAQLKVWKITVQGLYAFLKFLRICIFFQIFRVDMHFFF